jgi:hypothetical protein
MANYLTFSSPNSFTLKTQNSRKNWNGTLEYSLDTNTWNVWDGTTTLSANNGKLYLRGTNNRVISGKLYEETGGWALNGANISCDGNIETLLDYTTVANGQHPLMSNYCFQDMFSGCEGLISAPELPAITLADRCYYCMFVHCTSLTKAPALPATTLIDRCYSNMFSGCTSLVEAPELPAKTLAPSCYTNMFLGCTSLVEAPELPATILEPSCYSNMFFGCTSLITLPTLPATVLTTYCYLRMFNGCTNVKISTTKNDEYCNEYKIPTNGTGVVATEMDIMDMFAKTGGTFTGTPALNTTYYTSNRIVVAEEKPTATTIAYNGETIASFEMGHKATIKTAECEVEHDIVVTPAFPINITYNDITTIAEAEQVATVKTANTEAEYDIIVSAKETGYLTFSSPSSFTLATKNTKKNWDGTLEYSTDTSTWNVWDGTTTLSADNGKLYLRGTGNTKITGSDNDSYKWVLTGTDIACNGNIETLLDYITVINGQHPTMSNYCYYNLFGGCSSLISAPALPATTLTNECYSSMFFACTALVNAPTLPATTLAPYCYYYMFGRCTSLVTAPALPATVLASGCYSYMFADCTGLINAPALPATEVVQYCYNKMFNDCTSLSSIPALPAKTLVEYCYNYMFEGCTNIKISTVQTNEYNNTYTVPISGTGTDTNYTLTSMFDTTGGTFTGTPSINTTYYTNNTVVY